MKRVLQELRRGEVRIVEVPAPSIREGHVLIRNRASVISPGTERMLLEFGQSGWIKRVRQQPDKARLVIQKLKTDGFLPTVQAVRTQLDQPIALGYSSAGEVIGVGEGVTAFSVGDRVVSNGSHAQVVCIPQNLCAAIPDKVDDQSAAFAVLCSIALQGVRLANPTIGETFAVTGLGLMGLLTTQLLLVNGCRVIGIDPNADRAEMARCLGVEVVRVGNGEDPVLFAESLTRGKGVDGVILTAATDSSEPVHQAAQMCRKRGRIILVGVTGLELSRADFYEKELTFQVSCSYGPGRYDTNYELKGQDYPYGYVRWTEQRNFEAVLELMRRERLKVDDLITHRFPFERAPEAYRVLMSKQSAVGIVLLYGKEDKLHREPQQTVTVSPGDDRRGSLEVTVAVIGSGNYSAKVLLPALAKIDARLRTIVSLDGLSSTYLAREFRFEKSTTDVESVFSDDEINAVIIATRHDTHAPYARKALEAGKSVFVEKPLAISREQLQDIESVASGMENPFLMVGFNRRFAPQVRKMKILLSSIPEPKIFIMTVNAGSMPKDHWAQDPGVGGGRIVGEACHFIDLLRYLADAPILNVQATKIGSWGMTVQEDKITFTLRFEDGSFGTVHYLANGHRAFPKERLEVFSGGRVLQLNNFRKLRGYGWPGFSRTNLLSQDKGHRACLSAFAQAVARREASPVPLNDAIEVTKTSFAILELTK